MSLQGVLPIIWRLWEGVNKERVLSVGGDKEQERTTCQSIYLSGIFQLDEEELL